jgi:uncharacterized membrane protein YphA (DoxX/SURF4 family)
MPNPGTQAAQVLLRIIFTVVPIVAGADKFFHVLTDWHKYFAPQIAGFVGDPHVLDRPIGVVEIMAGLVVAFAPRIGGWIVGIWLLGVTGNLVLVPEYWDVALRDLGLAISAIALALLSRRPEPPTARP